ncbi:MAG: hypothetical protein ACOYOB_19765 [Myxococcota bacterium]|jgi:hypothetical protein
MAILNVSGTVQRKGGLGGAHVVVELLNPCMSGHEVAAVTTAGPDGRFLFPPVDTENWRCTVKKPSLHVRAVVTTRSGMQTFLGEGKCVGECCGCGGDVVMNVRLPDGLEVVVAPTSTSAPPPSSRIPDSAAVIMALRQAKQGQFDRVLTPAVLQRLERAGAASHGRVEWELAEKEVSSGDAETLLVWLSAKFGA